MKLLWKYLKILLDSNEELKEELGEILYKELDDLSFKFKMRGISLEHKAKALALLGYR